MYDDFDLPLPSPAPATGGFFGSAPTPAPATGFGGFGAAPATPFGSQQPQQQKAGTLAFPFQTTTKTDGNNQIVFHSISGMSQYEQKSFEELRMEDYLAGNKGSQGQAPAAPAPSGFGGAFGSAAPAPAFGAPAPTGGLFGSAPANPG